MNRSIVLFLAAWMLLVGALAAGGVFVRPPESPPLPIVVAALLPVAAFAAAYRASPSFRRTVLGTDVALGTALQSARAAGAAFLALTVTGVLPPLFAWPAGLGDMAIGFTAPFVALAVARRPDLARSRGFAVWNVLGMLDLVTAMTLGVLSSGFVPGLAGDVTTAPMARLPLAVVPAFLIPLFLMLHAAALLQARHARASSGAPRDAERANLTPSREARNAAAA